MPPITRSIPTTRAASSSPMFPAVDHTVTMLLLADTAINCLCMYLCVYVSVCACICLVTSIFV